MKRLLAATAIAALVLGSSVSARAEDPEIEALKKRVEALEKSISKEEVVDELGHKFHPIHSIYGLKVGGTLTMTAQSATHTKASARGAFALSADIALESPVGKDGRAVVVFDYQRGQGLQGLPSFFTSPNGNASGPNADLESFNNDQAHITQAYYEHNVEKLDLTLGQLDITGYFDANEFANNERSQFLANVFVNNPAIEFGGSADFYSPGARLTYYPVENFDISLGAFDGNGDYSETFDKPFYMAEANLKISPAGNEGNYRLYYWNKQGRDDIANTANSSDDLLKRAENKGVGVSIDQWLTTNVGVWLRAGTQREKVARFDKHLSAGVHVSGAAFNRENDHLGFGYAATYMGKEYRGFLKASNPNLDTGTERYMELYYNYAVGDATDVTGLHISPDIQYVMNPAGDTGATKVFIYGVRLQTFF